MHSTSTKYKIKVATNTNMTAATQDELKPWEAYNQEFGITSLSTRVLTRLRTIGDISIRFYCLMPITNKKIEGSEQTTNKSELQPQNFLFGNKRPVDIQSQPMNLSGSSSQDLVVTADQVTLETRLQRCRSGRRSKRVTLNTFSQNRLSSCLALANKNLRPMCKYYKPALFVGGSYRQNPTANYDPKRRKLHIFTHIYLYYWHISTCIGESMFCRTHIRTQVENKAKGAKQKA